VKKLINFQKKIYQNNFTDIAYIIKYNFGEFFIILSIFDLGLKIRVKSENYQFERILIQNL
jgi:hypothetical protein